MKINKVRASSAVVQPHIRRRLVITVASTAQIERKEASGSAARKNRSAGRNEEEEDSKEWLQAARMAKAVCSKYNDERSIRSI